MSTPTDKMNQERFLGANKKEEDNPGTKQNSIAHKAITSLYESKKINEALIQSESKLYPDDDALEIALHGGNAKAKK